MSKLPAAKRRRLSPPEEVRRPNVPSPESSRPDGGPQSDFIRRAAEWNLEQDYEQRPRKLSKKQIETARLPIKTAEGWIEQPAVGKPAEAGEELDSFLGSGEEVFELAEAEPNVVAEPKISQREQIIQAKEELARLASLINEDPEDHIGSLRRVSEIASSNNITVKKLALATQLAVYKDVIPGYRIRPVSEDEVKVKLSKEVKKLRNFEQAIVGGYQAYVHELARYARGSRHGATETEASLATVAISCACNLLLAVPHFNFRGELLKILVDALASKMPNGDFTKGRETLEALFRDDEDGHASLEAVAMLTKMMKAKHYHIHESVLNAFLHLRLLSEFSSKGSHTSIDKQDDQSGNGKKPKEKREFRTKKHRKLLKERKVIEQEMKEADAAVSHEERDRMQAEILKLVFVTYFRILKAHTPHLMGAVLEGLAKYAHLINQDFFADILEALKDLIADAESVPVNDDEGEDPNLDQDGPEVLRNVTRESLLCVTTAFALLQGQDASAAASTLHLDLGFFITHLYRTLYPVSLNPDIELSAKSLRLPDPHASSADQDQSNKVNVQTTAVLLLRSLSSILLPPTAVRAVPPVRIAAFSKQLLTASLHLPEKSCIAMLGLMSKVAKVHGRKIGALWNTEERRGDGVFDPLSGEVERSNPFASTVWEGELLRRHFCPAVRGAAVGMEKCILDSR